MAQWPEEATVAYKSATGDSKRAQLAIELAGNILNYKPVLAYGAHYLIGRAANPSTLARVALQRCHSIPPTDPLGRTEAEPLGAGAANEVEALRAISIA